MNPMKCLKIILLVSLSACSILIHPEKSASSEIGRNAVSAMLRKELSLVPSVAEVIPPSGFMGDAENVKGINLYRVQYLGFSSVDGRSKVGPYEIAEIVSRTFDSIRVRVPFGILNRRIHLKEFDDWRIIYPPEKEIFSVKRKYFISTGYASSDDMAVQDLTSNAGISTDSKMGLYRSKCGCSESVQGQ